MLRSLLIVGRNFRPISPFLAVFLVEEKGFTTKEIADKIIPWWLYSMLVFSLVLSWIAAKIGLLWTIISSVISEIIVYIVLINMKEKSTISTIFIQILLAYRNSTLIADKRFYSENDQGMSVKYSTIRKITGIMSSFISQNMYYISGSSLASMYLTIISQTLVLLCIFGLHTDGALSTIAPGIEKPVKITVSLLSNIFSYTGAFTLSVCFRIYIDLVLIERTGSAEEHTGLVGIVIDRISGVFYYISYGLIKTMSLLIPSIRIQEHKNKHKPVHGYLEGIARVLAVVLSIPLVIYTSSSPRNTEILMVISWILQILGVYALKKTKNIVGGYLAYLLSVIGTNITLYISYNGMNKETDTEILGIMSYIGGTSAAVHAIIDVISRRNKLAPQARFNIYAYLGGTLFACAGMLSIISAYNI
ncbi:hypothetical protein NEPAR06_1357 [Nematocida parisii]|uniref:Uncharacterized protein n=1 Tax=Nematocida parisii (strain ERTm3) TaxID=935791 RepID=I3EDN4_NEMP3|nr:uncharacterized protein NEPG_01548 [Nematocida parisii ERTm1]EIJ87331.1 hypothetical protein NEQG_02454 [Nematocida parisii ERTm3]KAI5143876.1 hypothetical protein NEPAR07_0925 [Nematocida parisii]EIJ93976.1 hypothetical protein NEPG_01548 [Nematocida parisii ERTm1]KAI5154890.1 hypothetical protein NEPAR06_1357 [Nematocida parisii]KAI5156677.1 hypothetical protein NEPAR05_0744 [Nematocida parisii]|eukprot:XP_013059376.1 hypothetical protein NEPG_01548 [Nematocida parisii ERTm1]